MIQNVTEPSRSFAAPATVAPRDSGGEDFEASLVEDEPVDSPDEDETGESTESVTPEPVGLEQFVRKPELVAPATGQAAAGTLPAGTAVSAETDGAEAIPAPSLGAAASAAATIAPAAPSQARPTAVPEDSENAAPADPAAAPAKALAESAADPARHMRDGMADRATIAAGQDKPSETRVASGADGTLSPDPAPLLADVTLHHAREPRPELVAQPVPMLRHGPAEARQIARQLARQAGADQDRIEITLTPEELGKVRLVMTPGETPTVSVYADHRETLELLRRHADVLMRELSDTGFGGASLSFGDGGQGDRMPQAATTGPGDIADAPPTEKAAPARPVSDRRLDIRI